MYTPFYKLLKRFVLWLQCIGLGRVTGAPVVAITSATEGMSRDYLVQQLSGQVSQVDIRYKITNLSVYLTTNLPSGVHWTSLLLGVMFMLRLTNITLKLPHKPYFTSIGAPTVHISCISRLQIIWLRSTLYAQQ